MNKHLVTVYMCFPCFSLEIWLYQIMYNQKKMEMGHVMTDILTFSPCLFHNLNFLLQCTPHNLVECNGFSAFGSYEIPLFLPFIFSVTLIVTVWWGCIYGSHSWYSPSIAWRLYRNLFTLFKVVDFVFYNSLHHVLWIFWQTRNHVTVIYFCL